MLKKIHWKVIVTVAVMAGQKIVGGEAVAEVTH